MTHEVPDANVVLQFNPLISFLNTLCRAWFKCFPIRAFSVIDGASLRIDDRLRVAKERREEADKQQGKRALLLCL